MLRAESSLVAVYVGLLEEGVPCWRPTQAIHLGDGFYRLLPTSSYDEDGEHWEFEPGSIVYCEEIHDAGSTFLRASALHPVQPKDLVGLPLVGATRVAGMAMFSFGADRIVETARGSKHAYDFALHLQCAWRIVEGETVLIGNTDIYQPADGREDLSDFDWDQPWANRLDFLMRDLLSDDKDLVVERVELSRAGGVSIFLKRDRCLEVFPNDSQGDEYWRLFRPYNEALHLVACGTKTFRS